MRFIKTFLCVGLALWGISLRAEVSVISVTDEDKHSTKADFAHTFEYYILPLDKTPSSVSKCQATRIGRRWFATAAHCVTSCQNGCQIQMDLLEEEISAFASVEHTLKKPAVFSMPGYSSKTFVKNDFALIKLDLDRIPLIYYRRSKEVNQQISEDEFNQFLKDHPSARRAFYRVKHPQFPPLVLFDKGNYVMDRKLSVIAIFGGKRTIKKNPNRVYYVKDLGFAYTNDFGIIKGMSGSGVMTNTGELVGLISGIFQAIKVPLDNPTAAKVQDEYFMFFVFNNEAEEFMKSVMGSDFDKLDWKDAYPSLVNKSSRDHSSVVERVRASSRGQQKRTPSKKQGKKS